MTPAYRIVLGQEQVSEAVTALTNIEHASQKQKSEIISDFVENVVYAGVTLETLENGSGAEKIFETDVHSVLVPLLINIALHSKSDSLTKALLYIITQMLIYKKLKSSNPIFEERRARARTLIWGGLGLYLDLLERQDDTFSVMVIEIISDYEEFYPRTANVLKNATYRIKDDRARAGAVWRLHDTVLQQHENHPDFVEFLQFSLNNAEYPITCQTAAICLLQHKKRLAPSRALDVVVSIVNDLAHNGPESTLPPGYWAAHRVLELDD